MSNTRGCVVSPRARRGGGEFTRRTRTTTTSRDRGGDAVTPRPHAPPTDLARRGGKRKSATPSFLVLPSLRAERGGEPVAGGGIFKTRARPLQSVSVGGRCSRSLFHRVAVDGIFMPRPRAPGDVHRLGRGGTRRRWKCGGGGGGGDRNARRGARHGGGWRRRRRRWWGPGWGGL